MREAASAQKGKKNSRLNRIEKIRFNIFFSHPQRCYVTNFLFLHANRNVDKESARIKLNLALTAK